MLKNNYAYTYDTKCCQFRQREGDCNCCPSPCCGDRSYTWPQLYVREVVPSSGGETSQAALQTGIGVDMQASEAIIGNYKGNVDLPYCTFFECVCCSKYYDTLEIMGKKMATLPYYKAIPNCFTYEIPVQDGPNIIGKLVPKERYIFCGSYISVQDTNGNQIYGIQAKMCQCSPCANVYQVVNTKNEILTQIRARNVTVKCCCHNRFQIDVNLPSTASDRDKTLLMMGSRFCHA